MSDYVIMTDSGCDLPLDTLQQWGVEWRELTFKRAEKDEAFTSKDMALDEFYAKMRDGVVFQTAAVNPEGFKEMFTQPLSQGLDVIFIDLSSGLSTTCNSAKIAAEELKEEFPDREVFVLDSKCASAGEGMMVWYAVEKKKEGASFEENKKYLSEIVPDMCHWFTVNDLVYLKRGGRVSAAAAFAATVLDIKPVLHVDDDGHLINMSKVRGRKLSIKALADKYFELAKDPDSQPYFISHGDCLEDAEAVESLIAAKNGVKATSISSIGPVIGSHAGPGTIALFFLGKKR